MDYAIRRPQWFFRCMGTTLMTALVVLASPDAAAQAKLMQYETKYYILHSDLDQNAVREADARISAMAEMYYERTKHFGGKIARKLPFYLFGNAADYYSAGGMPGSAGVFNGERLMAIAAPEYSEAVWHVVQHEGFHQFIFAVIGGDIPVWVNEGLAEYFGQALYTGDGFVTGVVPPARLARLQESIGSGRIQSLDKMMRMSYPEWNASLNATNYDQAWAMVHFLAHAESGRYSGPFNSFIQDVSRGMKYEHAWRKSFGVGTREFESKWRKYWIEMPSDATERLYAKAVAATLTGFLARAVSQKQTFETFDAFQSAAQAGQIQQNSKDWLPPGLLLDAINRAPQYGRWEITKRAGRFHLSLTMRDGTIFDGTFQIAAGRVVADSIKVATRK